MNTNGLDVDLPGVYDSDDDGSFKVSNERDEAEVFDLQDDRHLGNSH